MEIGEAGREDRVLRPWERGRHLAAEHQLDEREMVRIVLLPARLREEHAAEEQERRGPSRDREPIGQDGPQR